MKPYLLRSPQFDIASGGIRVMYSLYGYLLTRGQVAFLNTVIEVPSVGIYPEIYHGNDMMASRVIRYILQKPGMMSTPNELGVPTPGPTAFDPNDEIYVFSRVYDEWGVDDEHILFLPVIDLLTFKDLELKRDKKAFYVGKGVNLGQHPEDAIQLDRGMATDQQELAKFLNECQVLYVYDRMSAIMECARLCGCPVVYLGDLSYETLMKYEPGMNGLGYKEEVPLETDIFRGDYKKLIRIFEQKLEQFIIHTQQ